ncbi:efflux transporter outer membrane subunit [Chitinibacteraceae bacterium HSL-7]
MIKRILLLSTLALAGCQTTDWQPPAVSLPQNWQSAVASAPVDDASFWQGFGDDALLAWLARADAHNPDVALAAVRLRQAELASAQKGQARLPEVSASANSSASWVLNPGDYRGTSSGLTAGLSWEIDLWGRLADEQSAARWRERASASDLAAARRSMRASVAAAYWTIARDQAALTLASDNLARAQKTWALVEARYGAGVVSGLDRNEAHASVLEQESARASAELALQKSRWALGLLVDEPPQNTAAVSAVLPQTQPDVPAGVPAELLDRRPDLAAATDRLRASFADQSAARKSWYPRLSLTGNLGASSTELRDLLSNPIASLGAGLALPFIQWRDMKLANEVNEAEYEASVISYRKTVYGALQEVENALASRSQLLADLPRQTQRVADARQADTQTRLRYQAGAVAFDSVLNAEARLQNAEQALLELRYQLALASTGVYSALGGPAQ